MPTNPETRLTRKFITYLRGLKAQGEPVWWLKTHGAGFAKAGIPDLLICLRGEFFGIEVKLPGRNATPLQAYEGSRIEKAQGTFGVAHDLFEFKAILGLSEKKPSPLGKLSGLLAFQKESSEA